RSGNSGTAEGRAQDDRCKRHRQRYGAKIVDRPLLLRRSRAQDGTNEEQSEGSRWQVDIEDPPPRKMIDQKTSQWGADDCGDPEHSAKYALIATTLTRRNEVADRSRRRDDQPTSANALQAAGKN